MSTLIPDLQLATKLVAGLRGGPQCVEAAALLTEVGALLGYELEARVVSVFASVGTREGNHVTGEMGTAFGQSFLRRRGVNAILTGELQGGTPFERQAGHMIVVSQADGLIMDPTFSQFFSLGDQAIPLFASNAHMKNGRFWAVSSEKLYVRYFACDEYKSELDFDYRQEASKPEAARLVEHIRTQR
ncbi:hypothetical protein [Clavibacter phaseoli]|uniref:hypothetical protein n=1 Tax=Clavibacter phaseoli TaxID=1734031 RepID=UPI0011C22CE2|nr:hypothetical protein [Clavibacter phaseoli]